jgi:hypothetical protein
MKTMKLKLSFFLGACMVTQLSFAQIFTPSGGITGSSTNNSTGIGNVTLPLSNKLVISDAISNNGLLKLTGTNNLPNDKFWLGFCHGSNTTDGYDRARIGAEIIGGGAGRLFFTTGLQGAQSTRMLIDENGKVDISGQAQITGSTGINVAPSTIRNLKINQTYIPSLPTFGAGVGIEVNSPNPTNPNSVSLLVEGGVLGIDNVVKNPGGNATGTLIDVWDCAHGIGLDVNCISGTSDNIGVRIQSGGTGSVPPIGYGLHATAQGAEENIGVFGRAFAGLPGKISYGGIFQAAGNGGAKAAKFLGNVDVVELAPANASTTYGVDVNVTGTSGGFGNTLELWGEKITVSNAAKTYGIEIDASNNNATATHNYGLYSSATGDPATNYGVYAYAASSNSGPTANTNYGVYAEVSLGKSTTTPANGTGSYAGYFKGNGGPNSVNAAFFNGVPVTSAPGVYAISDKKFKDDISEFNNGLEKVMQLSPKTYVFKSKNEFPSFNFSAGKQYGFIAQELEKVIPEAVQEAINPAQYDHDGNKIDDAVSFKSVNYTALIPVLTAAIQEQQEMIAARDKQISSLDERIKRLEALSNNTGLNTGNNNNIEDLLYQNTPNPFNGVTEIRYRIPQSYTDANIMIFDMNGKKIKSIAVQGAEGSVSVSASEMAAGLYLYSLIIDGREIATKRMVVNK